MWLLLCPNGRIGATSSRAESAARSRVPRGPVEDNHHDESRAGQRHGPFVTQQYEGVCHHGLLGRLGRIFVRMLSDLRNDPLG